MVELSSMIMSLSLTACLSSQPVGGTPDEEGTGGESGGESSGGEVETDTDTASSGEVEETHVSLLDDCGLELSCAPLWTSDADEVGPQPAFDCALGLYAGGVPAVLSHSWPSGGFGYRYQDTFLIRADRRLVRQSRERDCSSAESPCDETRPWLEWGPHELCDAEPSFGTLGWNCEEVPDFTCDDLLAILAEPPNPPVPCEERPQEDCQGLIDADTRCDWIDELANYSSDSCKPSISGACEAFRWVSDCELNPTCEGAGTDGVYFREREDGTLDVHPGSSCYEPVGFERCSWGEPGSNDPPGPLEVGPAACDCAC